MTVLVTQHDPHPSHEETITIVIPPEGTRSHPKAMSYTREEAKEVYDALGDVLGKHES